MLHTIADSKAQGHYKGGDRNGRSVGNSGMVRGELSVGVWNEIRVLHMSTQRSQQNQPQQ